MTTTAVPASSPQPKVAAPPLGRHTARGFAWMLLQTVFTKGVGIIGQLVTAWFLDPHDFKLISLTYLVAGYAGLMRDAGLQTILVQRQQHLRRWVSSIFWLSLALGTVTAVGTILAAPMLARLFEEPKLPGLVVVVAIAGFFTTLGLVPGGIAQIQLRFRFQAMLGLSSTLLLQAITMLLAWRGFGAYSYILAFAACNLFVAAAYWIATPPKIHWRFHFRRWRLLLADSGTVVLVNLVTLLVVNGDYLALGYFHSGKNDDSLGLFYFSFNLSWQTVVLLTTNVGAVLGPALSRLQHDPPRLMQAYVRSVRTLALLSIPACLLQAAVTNPGFHLVFKPKWYPAIPITEVLCLGMAIRTVGLTCVWVNMVRGRFQLQLLFSAIYSVLFLATMGVAAKLGGGFCVAIAEAGFYVVLDPIAMGVILKLNGVRPMREMSKMLRVPLVAGAAAVGAAYLVGRAVPVFRGSTVVQIAIITILSGAIYIPLVKKLAPEDWAELWSLLRRRKAAAT